MPANPGTVQALAQLFTAIDVVAPLALGLIADRFGLRAAIACLVLQPLVIAVCAVWAVDREAERSGAR
jgi:MFS family permease